MNTIIDSLKRRYATKAYDSTKKVSETDLTTILEAMRLAPSSYGLQPWKFIVITDPVLRTKLKDASRGQTQITDASHLIVVTIKKNLTEADVDAYMTSIASTRNIPVDGLAQFKGMIMGTIGNVNQSNSAQARNAKQAYIALGFGLATAAILGIDATPMEGFDATAYNEILGLTDYTATVLMPIGYRSSDDASQHYAKVRFSAEQVIEYR